MESRYTNYGYGSWELKAKYQHNMLLAWLPIGLMVMALVLYLRLEKADTPAKTLYRVYEIRPDQVGRMLTVADVLPPQSKPSISSAEGSFAGVITGKISTSSLKDEIGTVPIFEPHLDAPPSNGALGDFIAYGDEDDPFGLGPRIGGNGLGVYPSGLSGWNKDNSKQTTQYVLTDSGKFILPPIPFPREASAKDTGIVVVEITIDKNNYISMDFQLVSPEGKGFKRVVEQALLQGEYAAAKINGQPVTRRFTTTIFVVLGHESLVLSRSEMSEFVTRFMPSKDRD